MKSGRYLRTYKHTTQRIRRKGQDREVDGVRERDRIASSRHGRRSRNRGTTTPVSSAVELRLRANYNALSGAGSCHGDVFFSLIVPPPPKKKQEEISSAI